MNLNIDGLQVACFFDWFKTGYGLFALFASTFLAFVGAWWTTKDEEDGIEGL